MIINIGIGDEDDGGDDYEDNNQEDDNENCEVVGGGDDVTDDGGDDDDDDYIKLDKYRLVGWPEAFGGYEGPASTYQAADSIIAIFIILLAMMLMNIMT